MQKITPFLWFDGNAETAVKFYLRIFKKSKITKITRYGEAGKDRHEHTPGSVMTIGFVLEGQHFTAINGGPTFKFTPALSLVVSCETQKELDHYWRRLTAGGSKEAQVCGWLQDKFGVSWQIVPRVLIDMVGDPKSAKSQRAMEAMMGMKKLNIAKLKKAYTGK